MKTLILPALLCAVAACSSPPAASEWRTVDEKPDGPAAGDVDPGGPVVQIYDVRDLTGVPSDRPLGIEGLAELVQSNVADVGVTPHEDSLLIIHGPAHAHRDVVVILSDLRGE